MSKYGVGSTSDGAAFCRAEVSAKPSCIINLAKILDSRSESREFCAPERLLRVGATRSFLLKMTSFYSGMLFFSFFNVMLPSSDCAI